MKVLILPETDIRHSDGFQISIAFPPLKDWNADLLASVQAVLEKQAVCTDLKNGHH